MTPTDNVIMVYTDPKYRRSVRVTCHCGHEWSENFPEELYEAKHMSPVVECIQCHTEYILVEKRWRALRPSDASELPDLNRKDVKYDGRVSKYRWDA